MVALFGSRISLSSNSSPFVGFAAAFSLLASYGRMRCRFVFPRNRISHFECECGPLDGNRGNRTKWNRVGEFINSNTLSLLRQDTRGE